MDFTSGFLSVPLIYQLSYQMVHREKKAVFVPAATVKDRRQTKKAQEVQSFKPDLNQRPKDFFSTFIVVCSPNWDTEEQKE